MVLFKVVLLDKVKSTGCVMYLTVGALHLLSI